MRNGRTYFTCYTNARPFLDLLNGRFERGLGDYQGFYEKDGRYVVTWWSL